MSDHPFTYDRWATPDDPEFGVVRVGDLRKIERACLGDLGYCEGCGEWCQ